MTGNTKVVAALQNGTALESQLNMQYRLDWRSVKFLGLSKTAKKLKGFGDDAHYFMKKVTDRLLFLGGDPEYAPAPSKEAKSLTATFEKELALEMAIIAPYESAIGVCVSALDDTSRNLFEHLLKWHEKHVAWLEQQLGLIKNMGESAYIAEKL